MVSFAIYIFAYINQINPIHITYNYNMKMSQISLLDYRIALNTNLNEKNKFNFPDLNIAQLKQDFVLLSNDLDLEKLNEILNNSFKLFDSGKLNEIDINDLKCCIHNLNLCPTESQMNEIYKELNVDSNFVNKPRVNKFNRAKYSNKKTKINFDEFYSVIGPILVSGKCALKSLDLLNSAFKILSKGNFLKLDYFENLMTSIGEKFKYEEIEALKDHLKYTNKINESSSFNCDIYAKDLNVKREEFTLNNLFKNDKYVVPNFILQSHGFKI